MIEIERKLKSLLFAISLLILIFLFYNNDFGIVGRVDNLQVSKEEYSELMESRTDSNLDNTFQLKVNGYSLPYDEITDSFMHSIKESVSNEEYNPIFDITMITNIKYDIALLDYTLSKESIKNNEPVKLLVYSDEKFAEYDIYLTTLPIFKLSLEGYLDEENPIGVVNQLANMSLYNSEEIVESDLFIRLRGGSSRAFPKNQYRINLREFTIGGDEKLNHQSLLSMRKDDDWILYSPYNDPEKVRNTLSNNLWHDVMAKENRFDINTGAKAKYVEVFMNNRYWGLYALMHPIDAKQLDLNVERNAKKSDLYYRSISNMDIEREDFEKSTGDERVLGRFELREPSPPFGQSEQWDPLYEHMMIQQANYETLEKYLFTHTDIQNQINYYLYTLLLQATDNNYKNHNYISKLDGETRVMLESPWDLDLTWGLHWQVDNDLLAVVRGLPTTNYLPTSTLIHEAMQQENTKVIQMVKEKYAKLRADEWSETSFMEMLDKYEQDIYYSGAILRDKERWPDTAYNENMDYLRNYLLERLQAMDDFIENEL